MHPNYHINDTFYENPPDDYKNKDLYDNFLEKYEEFKNQIVQNHLNGIPLTYYKFGDGDYLLFKNEKFGTTKPGVRDIKRSIKSLNIEEIKKYGNLHDKYFCEIINFKMIEEVLNRVVDYPAEYLYASIANKWFLESFKKITIIGSETKLNLIDQLMKFPEYKEYLGIDKFHELIPIPQKGALTNSKKIFKSIKKQVENSNPDIFLLGIGLSQNTLMYYLKEVASAPLVSVGSGIDAIAGVIDIYRPYYGDWVNYRIKNSSIYDKIKDPVLYSTVDGPNVKYL